ncbi:EamA family transporter RarD [Aggregatibacter segnis]|mgnify:FL=1|uniref:EamA family transporter RarD n=1 Tax=Aggregatibacter segnis TaxID=739 RepID=UPI0028D76A7A|nr:EamA family transporter RarD [Aggregatibacter segnis]
MLKGVAFSLFASLLFGYMYYFSTLLLPLSGTDIFGYRIVFTLPFVAAAVILFKQKMALIAHLKRIQRQPHFALAFFFTGALMGFQMWLFLWAPNNGSSLSVSFGYLLLPLVMVAAARIIFKERISRIKFLAVFIAAVGVISNIALKGEISWEALVICVGYTTYFVLRRMWKMTDLAAFFLEMLTLLPFCAYFAWQVDISQVQQSNPHILVLLLLLGLISGTALNAYILASNHLPMNLLGLLGYVEPCLMVGISLLIGEKIDAQSYPLFICLILAMLLIITDGILQAKTHQ